MEGNKSQPRAILVFGVPSSGKTTFCEKFAKQFKAPFYNFNELAEQYHLSRKHILLLIEQLAKTGQTLVIEGGINTIAERDEVRKLLRDAGYNPALVWIQTDVATVKSRLKQRLKSVELAKNQYDAAIRQLENPSEDENAIVLSGKHTFQTQLKNVLTQLA